MLSDDRRMVRNEKRGGSNPVTHVQFLNLKIQQAAVKTELDRRINAVLAHGQYIMGPEVAELETTLATYVGTKHCVTVASGTEALLIALMSLGVGPGDEIITTPFTFIATVEVIVLLGARPVFVDVEPHTGNINAALIEAKITARTKAIVPVSLYGQVVDMDEINAIAKRHGNIPVIEDAAQSFGATYRGKRSCGLSTIGCTSFFPSKPLGCYGDGGALFTDDDAIAQAAREIRVHGQRQHYVHGRVGVGGRMDTLQCAIVLAKWARFEWELEQRARIGVRYTQILGEIAQTLTLKPDRTSVYAQYTVLVSNRDEVRTALQKAEIPTAVHYPVPVNQQPAYQHLGGDGTPVADRLAQRVISLPMGPDLSPQEQTHVINALLDIKPLLR